MLYACCRNAIPQKAATAGGAINVVPHIYLRFCSNRINLNQVSFICFMSLVLSRAFHVIPH